jgi:hypothetical protein
LLWKPIKNIFDWNNMTSQDQRVDERYGLELTGMVKWEDDSGNTRLMPARIKNVCHAGAFMLCDSPIGEGRAIDVHIDLPFVMGNFIRSRIFASGRVVRDSFTSEGLYGHGIKFDQVSFSRLRKP